MNDKELADRIVAIGVGKANQIYSDALGRFYQIDPDADWQTSVNESKFVRDWRVAGALMEKCWVEISMSPLEFIDFINQHINGKSIHELPRAICEACVEALEAGK